MGPMQHEPGFVRLVVPDTGWFKKGINVKIPETMLLKPENACFIHIQ